MLSVASVTEDDALTVRVPPLSPTLGGRGAPAGAFQSAVAVTVSVEAKTVTLTSDVELPKASATLSWNVSTGGTAPCRTVGALKLGVSVFGFAGAPAGPAVCVHCRRVSGPAFTSWLTVPASISNRPEPTAKSTPAFATGAAPPATQFTFPGAGFPGHGVSWPTIGAGGGQVAGAGGQGGVGPPSGPEPCARKGRSWKLVATTG